MAAPPDDFKPGIISLDVDGRVLTSHFKADLFSGGPLSVAAGTLTLSSGFAGSLAEAIDAGAGYSFDVSATANVDIVDTVESIKALALVMQDQGLDSTSLFGPGPLSITLDDTPENIQALLNEPGLPLFDHIDKLVLPPGSTLEMHLSQFDSDVALEGVAELVLYGSIHEYKGIDTAGAPGFVRFAVMDSANNYLGAGLTDLQGPDFADVTYFRLSDTVTNLINTDLTLEPFQTLGVTKHQAADSTLNIDTALFDGTINGITGLQSIVLTGTAVDLGVTLPNIDTELAAPTNRIDGARLTDTYANVDGADYSINYMALVNEVNVEDIAGHLPAPTTNPFLPNIGNLRVNSLALSDGTYEMTATELDSLSTEFDLLFSSGGAYEITATTQELFDAESELYSGDSPLDIFDSLSDVRLIGTGTAAEVDEFFSDYKDGIFDPDFQSAVAGFEISTGQLDLLPTDLYSEGPELTFELVGATASISITGTAGELGDSAFTAGSLITEGPGSVSIQLEDDASAIRDEVADGNLLTTAGNTHIEDFTTTYLHRVGSDDLGMPLESFAGAQDWYDLEADVFSDGGSFDIAGSFDVDFSGISDVIDISAQTGVTSLLDTNPPSDFAFVDKDFIGTRTDTVGGKPAVDIAITEPLSTLIEFDGLTGAYDGTSDFAITLTDVNLAANLRAESFFGIPLIDQVTYGDWSNSTRIPTTDLLRFDDLYLYAPAADAFDFLYDYFYQSQDDREDAVDTLFNIEGDILVGDNDGAGPDADDTLFGDALGALNQDVIFGLDGTDNINGGLGNDYLDGGDGDDTVRGGDGDDFILDKYGVNHLYGGDGQDEIYGGSGIDTIFGGDDADTIDGKFGDDVIYGESGNDNIDGDSGNDTIYGGEGGDYVYGGVGNDTLFGGDGGDSIHGGSGIDTLYGGDGNDSDMTGGTGNDTLYGGNGNDTLAGNDGDDELYGDSGNDVLTGGANDDLLEGGTGNDDLDGGDGLNDTADYSAATNMLTVDLTALADQAVGGAEVGTDQLVNIENVTGGAGNDSITGDNEANTLVGNDGEDSLYGGIGFDDLQGGAGNDTIEGGADDDRISGGDGTDVLTGGSGMDVFTFAASSEFGDTILDFEIGASADSIELARGAVPGAAGFQKFGTNAGLLTSDDLFFALYDSNYTNTEGGKVGYAFTAVSTLGEIRTILPDGTAGQQAPGIFTSLAGREAISLGFDDASFADAFAKDLAGLFAPTKLFLTAPKAGAFTMTTGGGMALNTGFTEGNAFTATTAAAQFIAFGVVSNVGEGATSSALVMAVINNGAAGTSLSGGLNEITMGEISAYTIAVFDPPGASAPTAPDTGNVLLV